MIIDPEEVDPTPDPHRRRIPVPHLNHMDAACGFDVGAGVRHVMGVPCNDLTGTKLERNEQWPEHRSSRKHCEAKRGCHTGSEHAKPSWPPEPKSLPVS
jgi:hypothetical protein